jgi:predicted small metal-binding protein
MAKAISCRDVGVDCDFEATGDTAEEVMQKCAAHAKSAHGMDEIPAELAAKVESALRDV